ncbi:hypothetical protein HDU96_010744, partial [Phlyctochytrium bullatum]
LVGPSPPSVVLRPSSDRRPSSFFRSLPSDCYPHPTSRPYLLYTTRSMTFQPPPPPPPSSSSSSSSVLQPQPPPNPHPHHLHHPPPPPLAGGPPQQASYNYHHHNHLHRHHQATTSMSPPPPTHNYQQLPHHHHHHLPTPSQQPPPFGHGQAVAPAPPHHGFTGHPNAEQTPGADRPPPPSLPSFRQLTAAQDHHHRSLSGQHHWQANAPNAEPPYPPHPMYMHHPLQQPAQGPANLKHGPPFTTSFPFPQPPMLTPPILVPQDERHGQPSTQQPQPPQGPPFGHPPPTDSTPQPFPRPPDATTHPLGPHAAPPRSTPPVSPPAVASLADRPPPLTPALPSPFGPSHSYAQPTTVESPHAPPLPLEPQQPTHQPFDARQLGTPHRHLIAPAPASSPQTSPPSVPATRPSPVSKPRKGKSAASVFPAQPKRSPLIRPKIGPSAPSELAGGAAAGGTGGSPPISSLKRKLAGVEKGSPGANATPMRAASPSASPNRRPGSGGGAGGRAAANLTKGSPSTRPGPSPPSKAGDSSPPPPGPSTSWPGLGGAPAGAAPADKEERELLRKVSHSAIERRRRERINDKIMTLKRLVPACAGRDNLHKLSILQSTIEYILELQGLLGIERCEEVVRAVVEAGGGGGGGGEVGVGKGGVGVGSTASLSPEVADEVAKVKNDEEEGEEDEEEREVEGVAVPAVVVVKVEDAPAAGVPRKRRKGDARSGAASTTNASVGTTSHTAGVSGRTPPPPRTAEEEAAGLLMLSMSAEAVASALIAASASASSLASSSVGSSPLGSPGPSGEVGSAGSYSPRGAGQMSLDSGLTLALRLFARRSHCRGFLPPSPGPSAHVTFPDRHPASPRFSHRAVRWSTSHRGRSSPHAAKPIEPFRLPSSPPPLDADPWDTTSPSSTASLLRAAFQDEATPLPRAAAASRRPRSRNLVAESFLLPFEQDPHRAVEQRRRRNGGSFVTGEEVAVTVMNVGRREFAERLGYIQDAIDGCDFLSIDTELTGLVRDNSENLSIMDGLEERYARVRKSAQDFLVIQYGVCTFTWDAAAKRYLARPFNFYIFPSSGGSTFGLQRSFVSHPASFEFLVKNNFDFNKWITTGVPYLNQDDENSARHRIGKLMLQNDIGIDDKNRDFVEGAMTEITTWLQNNSDKTISVTAVSSYQKRLVHQEVRKRFNGYLRTEGRGGAVEVTRLTAEERNAGGDTAHLLDALNNLIGFRKVIEMITRSKKPVIGHNMYLDLCHTFEKFHKTLPVTVSGFKREMQQLFPTVYDTKYIAVSHSKLRELIPNTSLEELTQQCSSAPFTNPKIAVHPDFENYTEAEQKKFHDAGYDAYCTGLCFIRMLEKILFLDEGRVRVADSVLLSYANKLYLMRSDSPFLNLAGDDDEPNRDNLVYLRDFPREWRTSDLQKHMGELFGYVHVRWIDDASCFLALRDTSRVEPGLEELLLAQEDGRLPLALRASKYSTFIGDQMLMESKSISRPDEGLATSGVSKKRKLGVADELRRNDKGDDADKEEWTPNSCIIS